MSEMEPADCIGCGGAGWIFNVFTSIKEKCAICGGAGKAQVVRLTAGSSGEVFTGSVMTLDQVAQLAQLEETVRQQKHMIDELQKDNTRLLEERRKIDERYMVEHFHRVCDVPVLSEPQVPADERARLRLDLITEEYLELLEACFKGEDSDGARAILYGIGCELEKLLNHHPVIDLPEFADACADIKYVLVGSELEFGIDGRPIFKGVHEANMKKQGGPVREDGKRLKPEGWQPFDVAAELRRQGWKG